MTTATTYTHAEPDYYDAASDRYEFTRYSAEHDAILMESVVSTIRNTLLEQMARLEREAHGNVGLVNTVSDLTSFMLEEIGGQLDGPMCGLWHGMVRVLEAQPGKVAA